MPEIRTGAKKPREPRPRPDIGPQKQATLRRVSRTTATGRGPTKRDVQKHYRPDILSRRQWNFVSILQKNDNDKKRKGPSFSNGPSGLVAGGGLEPPTFGL